jgi:hypothetical protein
MGSLRIYISGILNFDSFSRHLVKGRDPLTMGYFDIGFSNKYENNLKIEKSS